MVVTHLIENEKGFLTVHNLGGLARFWAKGRIVAGPDRDERCNMPWPICWRYVGGEPVEIAGGDEVVLGLNAMYARDIDRHGLGRSDMNVLQFELLNAKEAEMIPLA